MPAGAGVHRKSGSPTPTAATHLPTNPPNHPPSFSFPPTFPPKQVQDVLKQSGKQLGQPLRLTGFVRVQVGEGLEAEQKDFAAEVAETLKATAA